MRKWAACGVLGTAAILGAGAAGADTASDRAAAILIFPRVAVQRFHGPVTFPLTTEQIAVSVDTVIQISNTSDEPVQLRCFYVNANSHCSASEGVCNAPEFLDMGCPLDDEVCQPGWSETDFHVTITARQPLAWRASRGLQDDDVPLNGTFFQGPGGQSNAGTRVPPVATETLIPNFIPVPVGVVEDAFIGELKCVVVDEQGHAIPRNVIKGEATTETLQEFFHPAVVDPVPGPAELFEFPGADKYSAIGIQAIGGDVNGDRVLELGGDGGEYNGCPNVLIVDHFFDDTGESMRRNATVASVVSSTLNGEVSAADVRLPEVAAPQITNPGFESLLTLVPCTQDLQAQVPGKVVAQYLVFNEFEQRFSTSTPIECYFERFLSNIDTSQIERSIFGTAVAGTISGQTRVRGVGGGLLGVLREHILTTGLILPSSSAAVNLHTQGERAEADRIVIPER